MSDGNRLYGVQFNPSNGRSYPFWEQQFDYSDTTTDPGATPGRKTGEETRTQYDQSPTDKDAAKGRQFDVDAIVASILTELYVKPTKLRVTSLPPTLLGVTVSYNKSGGTGEGHHPATQMDAEVLNAGSGSLSPRSTAQASASIVPSIAWNIDNWQADALVNAQIYEFSSQSPLSVADIITKLNAAPLSLGVIDLPVFKKKQVTLKLFGSQISIQQSADTAASLTFNTLGSTLTEAYSFEYGDTFSKETGVSVHEETSPYCIFGAITISSATDSQTCSTTVAANTPALVEGVTTKVAAITNEPATITGTATASVTPTSLSATTPSSIPTSGKYLVDVQTSDDEYGLIKIQAFVVDFSQYA